ncbi:MAG: proton-conducting transporter membrane subunit, partial [Pseudomonadota bacterium]
PSHVSAVMSGVMIKTGIYGILRVTAVLDLATPTTAQIVVVAGALSGVLGVVYALGQHDLKRLLAYHSVENIGIILLGMGLGMLGLVHQRPALAVLGFAGCLLHVLNHALFKSLLFLGAGVVQQRTGTTSIDALGGVLKKMRITGSAFIVGSIAISGLPPLNGFVSEVLVYVAGFQGLGLPRFDVVLCLLAILSLALIGGLALACFTKVVGVVFLGEPRSEAARNAREGGPATLVPMLVLTAICGIIGVLPGPFVRASLAGVAVLVPFAVDGVLAPTLAVSSAAGQAAALLVALVLGLWLLRGLLYHSKPVTRAATWGCGFTQPTVRMQYTGSSYASTLLEFFRPVAPLRVDAREVRGLLPGPASYRSHVQDLAEMAIERGVVQPVQRLFELLRWMQHGEIHLYIGYILLAIVVLLLFV